MTAPPMSEALKHAGLIIYFIYLGLHRSKYLESYIEIHFICSATMEVSIGWQPWGHGADMMVSFS